MAAAFIVLCPVSNPKLLVKAFPTLTLDPTTSMPVKASSVVTLLTPSYTLKPTTSVAMIYAAFISVTGLTFVVATLVASSFLVTIPKGFNS